MVHAATKRSSRNCSATAPIAAPPQSAASPIRFPPSRPVLPVPIATMDPTAQRNDEGGETGSSSLCRNPEDSKKVKHAIAPAAKRRQRKARHVSAGKESEQGRVPEGRHTGCETDSGTPGSL